MNTGSDSVSVKVDNILSSKPLLIVISGPSGVGKDATLSKMKELGYNYYYVVTMTTRPKRPMEKNGIDYHFVTESTFKQMITQKELLEWAVVYENYYGVPKHEIQQALKSGHDVVAKVDVQGATTIKKLIPEAVFIFLLPSSLGELTERLQQRGNHHSISDLNIRLGKAEEEMESIYIFDYVIVNSKDNLNQTASLINTIVVAEKCRVKPRIIKL